MVVSRGPHIWIRVSWQPQQREKYNHYVTLGIHKLRNYCLLRGKN